MEIIKAAQFAPSGEGMHGVEFVVIKDLRTKEKIFDITAKEFGQEFIKQAPALIIPICDTNKTEMSVQDL